MYAHLLVHLYREQGESSTEAVTQDSVSSNCGSTIFGLINVNEVGC
jgi:hypothetical protein